MAAIKTLPRGAPRLDGLTLARCWLAAGAAGVRVQSDRRLDRALVVANYVDADGRDAGLAFIGASPDLVVVAALPYYQRSVGPQGLWDLMNTSEPSWMVGVEDIGMGADRMRKLKSHASKVEGKGGKVWCTIGRQTVQPEGTLGDVGAVATIHVAIDGITDGDHITQASYSPIDWRTALPGADAKPVIPSTSLEIEGADAFVRLGRVAKHLPALSLAWEKYELPTGRTVRYVRQDDDGCTIEISEAVSFVPVKNEPAIWDVVSLDPLASAGPFPDDAPLGSVEGDEDWEAEGNALAASRGFTDEPPAGDEVAKARRKRSPKT